MNYRESKDVRKVLSWVMDFLRVNDREGACLALLIHVDTLDPSEFMFDPADQADDLESLILLLEMFASEDEHFAFDNLVFSNQSLLSREASAPRGSFSPKLQAPETAESRPLSVTPPTAPEICGRIQADAPVCYSSPQLYCETLPTELLDIVFGFLPSREKYFAVISNRSFNLFLTRIRDFASLPSISDAILLFREFNLFPINDVLLRSVTIPKAALSLQDMAFEYISTRKYWSLHVKDGTLDLHEELEISSDDVPPKPKYCLPDSDDEDAEAVPEETDAFSDYIDDCDLIGGLELIGTVPGFVHLNLSCTSMVRLAWIRNLVCLRTLNLERSQVTDLRPLAGLVNLQDLNLLGISGLQDLAPLAGLVKLKKLVLYNTGVKSLKALKDMRELEFLDVSETRVAEFKYLSGLVSLRKLEANGLSVTDLSPIAKLPSLRILELNNSDSLCDLSPCSDMVQVEELQLSGMDIEDLAPLASMKSCKRLVFMGLHSVAQAPDLSPLAKMASLKSFDLGAMTLESHNWKVISSLPKLEILSHGSIVNNREILKIKQLLAGRK